MEIERNKQDYNNFYELGDKIGKGSFGEVFKAKDREKNEIRAIKKIDIDNDDEDEDDIEKGIITIINELKAMEICSDNNTNDYSVKYYEYFQNKKEFIIVMELCDNNLLKIWKNRKEVFQPEEIHKIMSQLNNTFKIMVNHNIVHRDIKLENILVKYEDEQKKNYIVKLTDYGISKQITTTKLCKTHAGTGITMAPEILEGKEIYDNKCDLWSIGVIIYQLAFKDYPYKGDREYALLNNIKKLGQKHFKKTNNEKLDDLIRKLLVYESQKRINWEDYFVHPFFINDRIKEDYKKYYQIIGDKIGKGAFGSVYKAKEIKTNKLVAIKVIDIDINNEEAENGIKGLINELKNMDICANNNKNDYSVKYYEYFQYKNEFVIVMELCDDNLLRIWKKRKEGFKPEEIYKIMSQLNNTFQIMVKNKIVHRDIKLENILVKYEDEKKINFSVKLTDYGISKQITGTTVCKTHAGTRITMAPEVLEGKVVYDNKCDLWSIGVIIYQLAFKEDPYNGTSTEVVLLNDIINSNHKKFKQSKDQELNNLIKGLLIYDITKRISWEKYFNHPFFRSKEDYKQYYEILGERIGKGTFGNVFRARNKKTNDIVAIKIIDIDDSNTEEDVENAINLVITELKNMEICTNDNMNPYSVRYYEYFKNNKQFIIVMELCDDNLEKILKDRKKGFDPEEILKIMNQLNNTFKIMVNHNIVHRDLKLENILIKYEDKQKKNFIVKLTDYGVSKQVTTTKLCKTHAGTSLTMAPEVLEGEEVYNNQCDLWSIGVIIYQLFFKDYPYKGATEYALINNIKNLGLKALQKTKNENLDNLLSRLLIRDRRERLTWDEYFAHPFFNKDSSPKQTKKEKSQNQIIIKLKVSKTDKEKYKNKIFFLSNELYKLNGIDIYYDEDFNELNKENTELYINDEKKEFCKYFEPSLEEGEYTIKLILKNKIKSCRNMFRNCQTIRSIDLSSFDSSEVEDMSRMFFKCIYLEELKLSNLDTKNVSNMEAMFQKCKSIEKIEFPQSFITNNVKNISLMFHDCNNLNNINISFDTQKVENMRGLFQNCFHLKKLDLSSFKTDKVKKMNSMFENCCLLEEIKFDFEKFKTTSVECMSHMFKGCKALPKLNLNSFNTEKVKYMNNMFRGCEQLLDLNLSNFSSKSLDDITYMFQLCSNLKKINISSFNDDRAYKFNNMFDECPNLEEVKVKNENIISKFQKEFEKINFKI